MDDKKKYLADSVRKIKDFNQENTFRVASEEEFLNKSIGIVKFDNDNFLVKLICNNVPPTEYLREAERLFELKFKLLKGSSEYTFTNESISSVSFSFSDPFKVEFKTSSFKENYKPSRKNYFRLVIPIKNTIDLDSFELSKIKIRETVHFRMVNFTVNSHGYDCFNYKEENIDDRYLIIDSNQAVEEDVFNSEVETILLLMALSTGNLYKGHRYLLCYETFEKPNRATGIKYEYFGKSIITDFEIFDPNLFSQVLQNSINDRMEVSKFHKRIPHQMSTKMLEEMLRNPKTGRIIEQIIEANDSRSLLLRASIYSIALESLTNIIYKLNEDRLNPINDKKLSDLLINKFKDILNEYSAFIEDDNSILALNKKLESINKPLNADKLVKSFSLLGLELNEHDKKTLNFRNKFLHGSSPIKNYERDKKKKHQLAMIATKLHLLLNSLLLKYLGYSGHIKNLYAIVEIKNDNTTNETPVRLI